jgi:hypothetical protein
MIKFKKRVNEPGASPAVAWTAAAGPHSPPAPAPALLPASLLPPPPLFRRRRRRYRLSAVATATVTTTRLCKCLLLPFAWNGSSRECWWCWFSFSFRLLLLLLGPLLLHAFQSAACCCFPPPSFFKITEKEEETQQTVSNLQASKHRDEIKKLAAQIPLADWKLGVAKFHLRSNKFIHRLWKKCQMLLEFILYRGNLYAIGYLLFTIIYNL